MQHPKFINPFTDFGFKKIFGEEANKDLLINFLNELLAYEGEKIAKLTYKKNERLGLTGIDRNVVFDLFCENEKGEKFTVELQKAKQSFFKDRMIYYSSFSIQEQGEKGLDEERKAWNYRLKAVYVIGILDFIIDERNKDKIVVSHNKLMDTERKTVFYDKLTFVTIQMPNFNKKVDDLETNFDKWLYVIKNLGRLDKVPEKLKDKIFRKVFKVAEYAVMNRTEQAAYEDSLKYYRDLYSVIDTSKEEGIKEAESKFAPIIKQKDQEIEQKDQTIEQNKQELEQKDQALEQKNQALEQKNQALINSAKAMLQAGMSIEQVQAITNLSAETLKKLR